MVIKDFIPEDALFQPLEFGETKGLTDEEAAERLRRDNPEPELEDLPLPPLDQDH